MRELKGVEKEEKKNVTEAIDDLKALMQVNIIFIAENQIIKSIMTLYIFNRNK